MAQASLFQAPAGAASRITLRPYQEEAREAVLEAWARGERRPLVVLPTGMGKTVLFAAVARAVDYPCLVIAHRDELLDQAADKFRMQDPGVTVGKVKAEQRQWWSEVVVASVQTLARDRGTRELRQVLATRPFRCAIVDEAHHAPADSYQNVMDVLTEAGVPLLGVTATPERGTGGGLEGVWGELVYSYSMLDGIRHGYLADVRGLRVELADADLDRVRVNRGDWQDGALGQALHDAGAPAYALKAYLEHAPDRKGLVFTPTVELAHEMADTFQAAGVPAEAVDGTTPDGERRAILRRLRTGETRVVANCAVLTEGFDEPSVDLIVIARPTLSRVLYVQMVGRGTRTHPGKQDCLVMDLVGVTERHRLQSVANLFGVREEEIERGLTVVQAVAAQQAAGQAMAEQAQRLMELAAEAVDLFTQQRLNWLKLNDAVWVLRGQQGQLELRRNDETGLWLARYNPDDKRLHDVNVLGENLDLGYAQGIAEDYVRRAGGYHLVDREAPWRSRPVTPGQVAALAKWQVPADTIAGLANAGEASDLLNEKIARSRAKKARAA